MKIWTVEFKYKFVSFATEALAFKHIAKIIRENIDQTFRGQDDPLYQAVLFLLNNDQFKLAHQVTEKYASRSLGIRLFEQDLMGHVME